MAGPTRYDIAIRQSSDVDFTAQVWADEQHTVVQNLTNWTATMKIRPEKGSATTYLSLTSTPAAGLTINGPAGQVTVHIAASVSTPLTWIEGVYDLFVHSPDTTIHKCVLFGDVTVTGSVTV